ncbi:hypothetical protein ACFFP0_14310 [Rhizobium puerariae]|uniref:Uncharacterized protein n=1 Tax=Rhizobium puerariae TaxID=1585791 RepID=A0ABV6AJJ4_9HYPH
MADLDPAHLLFPTDAPAKPAAPADNGLRPPTLTPTWTVKAPAPAAPPHRSAGQTPADPAEMLFGEEARKPSEKAGQDFLTDSSGKFAEVVACMDQAVIEAFSEGDRPRGEALKLARDAIIDDAIDHGTDKQTVNEAFAALQEVNKASFGDLSEEQLAASYSAGMAAVQAASISDDDLNAARAFIRDMEEIAPGTIASLERRGAGNDIRIIKKAVAEARRRGY